MSSRHALLIGVPRYDDVHLNADPHLGDAVRNDVAAMRTALKASGYEKIAECGVGNGDAENASPSRIRRAIEEACATVPDGGVLLLYFSGHGVTEDGVDYLIPSDAWRRTRQPGADDAELPPLQGALPVVPDDYVLASCRARLVVFFVDACRDDQSSIQPVAEPGGKHPYLADGGHFVLVMGCRAGQTCQYDETGSAFTRSLAKTLDPTNPARTLDMVVADVSADMARRSRQSQGSPQEPVVRYPALLKLAGPIVVCDGDELTDAWRKAVAASALLPLCDDHELVQSAVAECARRCGEAQATLRKRTGLADPWTDQNYPGRMLLFAELLLRHADLLPETGSGTHGALRPGEAAMLIAVPFLREAVLAAGIRDAAGVAPADPDRTYTPGTRGDLELTHEMHQNLVSRMIGLRQRGGEAIDAADSLAMWLVHQWLGERVSLWEGAGAAEVYALALPLIGGCAGSASDREVPWLIQALLFAVSAEPADERLIGRLTRPYVSDRWKLLAAVAWLAGILAADPRCLPPVVPDLVGTRMELPLSDVQDKARRADWTRGEGGTLNLTLVCEHPALHDAFEDIARRAARAAETIRTSLNLPAALADKLPQGFTATGLRPAMWQDEQPSYDVPLSRFQIAEEKVRELLMGRQLYGEPALAIRELYQNALDACRWRKTRSEYLKETGQSPPWWDGLITFTQGTEDGRPYIQCEDNGIGMDLNTLKHVFANAGERFVYGQEFRTEQAAWAMLSPPLRMVSNSQFGVGVFSYFMLADEITVLTRHQGRDGVPDRDAHEVRIASSGSLIQIRPASGMPNAGTKIRLYLSGDTADTSVLKTLRDLLWVAEFRVEVNAPEVPGPDEPEVWKADELHYHETANRNGPMEGATGHLTLKPGDAPPLKSSSDLWWVHGNGGLAADGIRTDKSTRGVIVNLSGEHRPQFTVDRRTLRSWDAGWVVSVENASLPALMEWAGFSLSWLWHMVELDRNQGGEPLAPERADDIARAQRIFEFAVATGRRVSGGDVEIEAPVPLSAVGCVAADRDVLSGRPSITRWLRAWREGIWRNHGYVPGSNSVNSFWASPVRTDGHPVPTPLDGVLIHQLAKESNSWEHHPAQMKIQQACNSSGFATCEGLRRLRRYAITGLDLRAGRRQPDAIQVLDPHIAALRSMIDAWPPPGEPEARELVALLVKATRSLFTHMSVTLYYVGNVAVGKGGAVPDLEDLVIRAFPESRQVIQVVGIHTVDGWVTKAGVGPGDLASASRSLDLPIREIVRLCESLAPLGVSVASREAYPEELDDTELQALSLVGKPGQSLTPLQLLRMAISARAPVGAVHNALARLEERGLLVRPTLGNVADFIPSEPEMELLGMAIRRNPAPKVRGIDKRLQRTDLPWMRVVEIITRHREIDAPWRAAAYNLAPYLAPPGPFTELELVELAHRLHLTLGEAAGALREVYPGHEPQLDDEFARLTVPSWVHEMLLGDEITRKPSWTAHPFDIIKHALVTDRPLGDCLAELAPFRLLGARVPSCNDAIKTALNQEELDGYDADMLVAYDASGRETRLQYITALHLIQTAARLGWTPAEAHQRFGRLVPIGLEFAYPQVELPDEVVYWYDLQALTAYFDGQAPVISGPIDQVYLEHAAAEIFHDVPPEELPAKAALLRDRLRIYAPLFTFELETLKEDPVG
jgi:hypothetical protein